MGKESVGGIGDTSMGVAVGAPCRIDGAAPALQDGDICAEMAGKGGLASAERF